MVRLIVPLEQGGDRDHLGMGGQGRKDIVARAEKADAAGWWQGMGKGRRPLGMASPLVMHEIADRAFGAVHAARSRRADGMRRGGSSLPRNIWRRPSSTPAACGWRER